MEKKLRHHIIEALVILALLAIFIPLFFRTPTAKNYFKPEAPPTFPLSKKQIDHFSEVPEFSADTVEFSTKPRAWVIQLGSFEQKINAKKLMRQLQRMKLHAFTYEQTLKDKAVIRVYVGPETNRQQAEKMLANIEHDINTKGIVIAFNPLQL